jgi:cytochrome P450
MVALTDRHRRALGRASVVTVLDATRSIADPAAFSAGVPHDVFRAMRRDTPIAWVDEPVLIRHNSTGRFAQRGRGYWAVTRYADVLEASCSPAVYSSAREGVFLPDPRSRADLERNRQLLINMDAPDHGRIRRVVSSLFTRRAVRTLRQSVEHHARAVVRRCVAQGEFDLVDDLAADLPLLVLADLLGIPRVDRRLLHDWSDRLVGFDDPEFGGGDIDAFGRAIRDAVLYARDLRRARLRYPRDDLVSHLASATVAGDLSEGEYCMLWLLLVVAGNETTRNLLSGGVLALIEHRQECRRLADDPNVVPSAVEELLRWVTPIMQFRRTVTCTTVLGDQEMCEGDKVVLYYVSANRDEARFRQPDRLDVGREPNPHMAFGVGPHFCLGAHLARLEAAAALDALRPHLARLAVAGPVCRLTSNFMNGLKRVPMRVEL